MVLRLGSLVALLGFTNLVLSAPADITEKRQSTLVGCLQAASVPIIETSTSLYSDEILPFNLRVPFFPQAVAVPETPNHVSSAVICAQLFDVKVAARCGGHSYAGFGLGGKDGSLMIDMKKFKSVVVDPNTNIATIGAGTRLGDVAYNLFNQGGRALPHGLCPALVDTIFYILGRRVIVANPMPQRWYLWSCFARGLWYGFSYVGNHS